MNLLTTLNFHGTSLLALPGSTPAETLVVMRPVVGGMGLDWSSQLRRIKEHELLGACVVNLTMQVPDDIQAREHTCLPLNRLHFWLATLQPNMIPDPDTRARVLRYQEECADVLFEHFFGKVMRQQPVHDFILEGPIFPIAPILFGDVYLSTFYCPTLSARLWPLDQLKKVVPTGKLDGFPVKRAIKAGLCFDHNKHGPLVGMDALVWHSQELARKQFGALHDNMTCAIKRLIEAAPEIATNNGEVKCLTSP